MKAEEKLTNTKIPKARGIDWLIALGLFLLYTFVYWLTVSQDPSIDSYATAHWVKSTAQFNWFHPHHLLFSYACRFVNLVYQTLFPPCDLLMLLTRCMHIVGGLCIALLYLRLYAMRISRFKAASIALMTGTCYGMWLYSTIFELVIPYLAMFLAAWAAAHRWGRANRRGAFAAGAVLGAGVLIHQTLLIYLPAFLIFISMLADRKNRWQRALYYLIGCAAVTCISYLMAFLVLGLDFPSGWFQFFTNYAQTEAFRHGTPADIVTSARHMAAIWSYPILYANPLSFRFMTAMILLVVFTGAAVYRTILRNSISTFCLTVFATAFIFFTWWSPDTLDFYLIPAVMIVLPAFLIIKWRFIPLVFVALTAWLFFFNNFPEIKYHAQPQINCVLEAGSRLQSQIKPNDKVFWTNQLLDACGTYLEMPAECLLVSENINEKEGVQLFTEYAKNACDYAVYYDGLFAEIVKKSGVLANDKELDNLMGDAKMVVCVETCSHQLSIWKIKREAEPGGNSDLVSNPQMRYK